MEKEREEMTNLELAKAIMDRSGLLGEVGDIASAILGTEDMRDMNERITVINALAYRLDVLYKETTSIWLDAHTIWMREKQAETDGKTPEQELLELEEETKDDLPFC